MTDRRDPETEELRTLLAELETTLVALREELDDERADGPRIPRGLPGGGRRAPKPPRLREVLRFTESYTIPTLIAVLEANVRLLRLGGAALRALDPERSAVPSDGGDGAVGRAIDAGRGLSTGRLASGLDELNDALSGTDAPNPEARDLLSDAEELSSEVRDRLRASRGAAGERAEDVPRREGVGRVGDPADADEAVHIDVAAGSPEGGENDGDDEEAPAPDVDAELDSIREEVRGPDEDDERADDGEEGA